VEDIAFYENVFAEAFCKYLFRDSLQKLSSGREFARSNFQWQPQIVKASAAVLVRDYDEVISAVILQQLHDKGIIDDKNGNNYHVMNYIWTKLSYIPWHSDNIYINAITIYLNERWDPDWGGIFLYYTDKESPNIKGYIPKFNTAVKNNNRIAHSTTMISTDAESPRVTVQLFTKAESK
jgi:Rps23 Pro-64 3,4-dihydroxylase Tpa1-like proline 4-hydroxylase